MKVAAPLEAHPCERRVALVPSVVPALAVMGAEAVIEAGAGSRAGFTDSEYKSEGASLSASRADLFESADVVAQVSPLGGDSPDLALMRSGLVLIGLLDPLGSPEKAAKLAERGVTSFAMELIPRISRAQPMDALTSQATIAGYKAVIMAAAASNRIYPMMMTPAGTVTPSHVLVLGAGVAGLQAIATARRLGAVVQAYDVRPEVKEQVESLGARFLEVGLEGEASEGDSGYARAMDEAYYERQRELMTQAVAESDVVVTTAAVPGRRAPVLVSEQMVREMRPGSVIVDLAAETGGNCELTRPGEDVTVCGVQVMGPRNVPSSVPYHASQMYAKNIAAFLKLLVRDGEFHLDMDDAIVRDTLLTHEGEVVNARVRELLSLPAAACSESLPQSAGEG